MGIIISAFATCGKSVLGKKYKNVIDLESSSFKCLNSDITLSVEERKGTKRDLNPLWPQNYYNAIKQAIKQYDIVLVQLKPEHFDYFDKHDIKYSIAYPNIENWQEVEERCLNRGNNKKFIKRLKEVFIPYYQDAIKRNYNNDKKRYGKKSSNHRHGDMVVPRKNTRRCTRFAIYRKKRHYLQTGT